MNNQLKIVSSAPQAPPPIQGPIEPLACPHHREAVRKVNAHLDAGDDPLSLDPTLLRQFDAALQCHACRVTVAVAQDDLPVVTGLAVVDTAEVEMHIRNQRPRLEGTQLFAPAPHSPLPPSSLKTCLAAVWAVHDGGRSLPALDVDEMCYIHLAGRVVVRAEGAAPVTLDASQETNIIWLPGNMRAVPGVPALHFTDPTPCGSTGSWAAGLLVMVREAGLRWTSVGKDVIEIDPLRSLDDRPVTALAEYWRSLLGAGVETWRPPVLRIPRNRRELKRTFDRYRRDLTSGEDRHRDARAAGHLAYADIPGWPIAQRRGMLDFLLVKLPRRFHTSELRDFHLAKHPSCYELLVPLQGRTRCVGAEIPPERFPVDGLDRMDFCVKDVRVPRSRFFERPLDACTLTHRDLPDYATVRSEAVFHGFMVGSSEDAYVLHVRSARNLDLGGDHHAPPHAHDHAVRCFGADV